MTLNTFYVPVAVQDTFVDSFIVIDLTFIKCLPGVRGVGDTTVNKITSAFKELTIFGDIEDDNEDDNK